MSAGRTRGARNARIGLVGPLPPPSGGMANQTQQLARLLVEGGLAVEIVQVNEPYRPAWIGTVRGLRAVFRLIPYLMRLWRATGRADVMHVMANSGWAWHLCAAPAIWIAKLRGVPAIVNYRGGEAEKFLARQGHWVRPTLRRAFAVIVPSTYLADIFERVGIAAQIVPNIVDLTRFRPAPERGRAHRVAVTRNLEAIYDIPTAIRAFAMILRVHPDATLAIAGSGPERRILEAMVRDLGLDKAVTFTGRLDSAQMGDLYRACDLVLNPSTVDNTPNSLLEAMASGIPVVSTNVGGIPHLVADREQALLVPPRDPAAMAAAALAVFGDPQLAKALASAGLACAQRHTWAQVRPHLYGVYARAMGIATPDFCPT